MKIKTLFFTIIFCLSFLAPSYGQYWSGNEVKWDEYEVYCYCLWQFAEKENITPFFIVSNNSAHMGSDRLSYFGWDTVDYIESKSGIKLGGDIINDFRDKNRDVYRFRPWFTAYKGLTVYFMYPDEMNELLRGAGYGWEGFYTKYEKAAGLVELSRVGFSSDGAIAFLYMAIYKGYLSGEGYYIIMQKQRDGSWLTVAMVRAWES